MISPEAMAVSPGTVTNIDINPFCIGMEEWLPCRGKPYSRADCQYESMARRIVKQCGCKPRFFDDAWDICEDGMPCNGTCRGAGITCAAEMGMVAEYTDCPKPCFDVAMNENSVSYSGKLLHVNHILSLIKC